VRKVEIALHYAQHGWLVFPVHSIKGDNCTCGQETCSNPGKHPLTKGGFHEATRDATRIERWWRKWPWANIGIRTGEESDLVVIDQDNKPEAEQSMEEIRANYGGFPNTLESKTGSGGRHILFKHPGVKIPCGTGKLGEGIDVRGDGGYILAPPSKHVSGRKYTWDAGTLQCGLAEMPPWLIEVLKAPKPPRQNEPIETHLTAEQVEAAEKVLLQHLPGARRVGRHIHGYIDPESRSKAHLKVNLEKGCFADWRRTPHGRPVGGNIKQLLRMLNAPIPPELAKTSGRRENARSESRQQV